MIPNHIEGTTTLTHLREQNEIVNSIPQFLFFGPRIINEMRRQQKGEDMCGLGVSLGQLTMEF